MIAYVLQESGLVKWYDEKRRVINGRYGKLLSYTASTVTLQEGGTIYVLDEKGHTITSRFASEDKTEKPTKHKQSRSSYSSSREDTTNVGTSHASSGNGSVMPFIWLLVPIWGPWWLVYKALRGVLKMFTRGWFWKFVFPIVVLPVFCGSVWLKCQLMDENGVEDVWRTAYKTVGEKYESMTQQGDEPGATKMLADELMVRYWQLIGERQNLDNVVYISRYFKHRPWVIISGRVRTIDKDQMTLELIGNKQALFIEAPMCDDELKCEVGDYVVLRGYGASLGRDKLVLDRASVKHKGAKGIWEVMDFFR